MEHTIKTTIKLNSISILQKGPGWRRLYFRLDIILIKGLSKHTLNTYFSGMKIDPKYEFLHAFVFLSVMSFPKFVNMTKNTPFFQFCTPKRCSCVHCLVLKNNPNYVNFFNEDDIQLQIQVPPPAKVKRN